jgi:hypothetical protein
LGGEGDGRGVINQLLQRAVQVELPVPPAYYLELNGQGHGYVGVDAQTQYYRAVFDFLGKLDRGR